MKVYEGKSVFNGIAIGKIKLYLKGEQQVKRHKVTDVKAELLRYEEARNKSMTELKGLYEKALKLRMTLHLRRRYSLIRIKFYPL